MRVASIAMLLALSGCTSSVLLGDATTVRPAVVQAALEVDGFIDPQTDPFLRVSPVTAAGALRTGLTDWLDLGVKVFPLGAAGELRAQIFRGPLGALGADALIGLSAGSKSENRREFDIVKVDTFPSASAFVTLGLNLSERVTVLLAQRTTVDFRRAGMAVLVGGNVALKLRLTAVVSMLYEYALTLDVAPPFNIVRHEGGVGFLFDVPTVFASN